MFNRFSDIIRWVLPFVFAIACAKSITEPLTYKIENNQIVFEFTSQDLRDYVKGRSTDLESFKEIIRKQLENVDSVDFGSSDGWRFVQIDSNTYQLVKNLNELEGCLEIDHKMMLNSFFNDDFGGYDPKRFGYNSPDFKNVIQKDSLYIFYIPAFDNAHQVLISGIFNNWNTLENPMHKTDSGWIAQLKLHPGRYEYKYIIDGIWTEDPFNPQNVTNQHGTLNSVYVVPNYTFKLTGFRNAKEVILAGEFVNWNEHLLKMKRRENAWTIDVYMPEGSFEYKFIVDGNWILDPENEKIINNNGNQNSLLEIGEKQKFYLKGYQSATDVYCTGSFNDWSENALPMKRNDTGWECERILPEGNYKYKFIVDGEWINDPANDFKIPNEFDTYNTWRVIGDAHWFKLQGFQQASEVILSGTFNDWNEHELKMHFNKMKGQWEFPYHLPPGKHAYKFIVDGIWMTDPDNQYSEHNREGTYNSIIWVEI